MQVNGNPQCRQPAQADTATKSSNNRGKRKARWKLKFHHQALPPEYLDHYEASLQQNKDHPHPGPKSPSVTYTATSPTTSTPTTTSKSSPKPSTSSKSPPPPPSTPTLASLQSTVRYKDLPYMGEMTLDNARPRRGRKPKKADICHLIYKNYGTTVVDEPLNLCVRDLQVQTSNETPPSEVSMCKFKFTGGAQPSLQEKKSISMNTTGNLRLLSNNRARSKELKRKSRKSLAREKLEKTFKEKGFLIQTQQLESAQGATYCKFRQLRKFTRYLFRSWKHHLPGDIVNNNNTNGNNNNNNNV